MSKLVQLTDVGARWMAQPIIDFLADNGITATVTSDDCGGVDPALNFVRGTYIMVIEEALETAQQLMKDWDEAVIIE